MPSPIFEYVDGAFVQIPGALWNVRAGSRNGVWGLNGANEIYYLDRNDHTAGALGSFNQVGGALTQISVGTDDSVFGLNAAGMIYTFDRTDFRGSKYGSFHQIPGALVSISAYSQDSVFGINAQNDIFKLVTSDTSASPYGSFQKVDRTLLRQKPFQVIAGPDGSCVGRFYRDRIDDDCVFRIPTGEMQAFSMSSSRIDAIARGGPGELYGGGIGGDLNLHRFDGITWPIVAQFSNQVTVIHANARGDLICNREYRPAGASSFTRLPMPPNPWPGSFWPSTISDMALCTDGTLLAIFDFVNGEK